MSIVDDILGSYVRPRKVVRRILSAGPREDWALAMVMTGCTVVFVAQWPRLAREAHLSGDDLNIKLGGALFAWLLIMPLVLYALALLSHWLLRATGGQGSGYDSRVALFWALLASTPLMLVWGLMAGFAGPGVGLDVIGAAWLAVFAWFWIAGLIEARGKT